MSEAEAASEGETSSSASPAKQWVGHLPAVLSRRLSPLLDLQLVSAHAVLTSTVESEDPSDDNTPSSNGASSGLGSPSSPAAVAQSKQQQLAIEVEIAPAVEVKLEELSARQIALWRDLSLFVSSSASLTRLTPDERVVRNFRLMATTAASNFAHLFLPAEQQGQSAPTQESTDP